MLVGVHALMQDAHDQDSAFLWDEEYDAIFMLESTQAGSDRVRAAAKTRMLCERLKTAVQPIPKAVVEPVSTETTWPLGTSPVKWNMFGRVRSPLKLVSKRVDGADGRLTPSNQLRTRARSQSRVHS